MGKRKTPTDWKAYKELVNRGKNLANAILEIKASDNASEVEWMNERKNGRPYEYSHSIVILPAILKSIMKNGYRNLAGVSCLFLEEAVMDSSC